jgi:type IV pilus assembly protein PilP
MPRTHSLFAIAVALTACGTQKTPSARRVRAPAVQLIAAAEPAPRTDALYVYSPVGKRDPFTATPRHDGREQTLLQKWPVDQFVLKTTVTGTASPKAVIQDPDSRAWLVGIGDSVGNNSGKITSIDRDQIIVTEAIDGPNGRFDLQRLKLMFPSPGTIDRMEPVIDEPPRR